MQRLVVSAIAAVAAVAAVSFAVASGSDQPASAAKTIRADSRTVSVEAVDTGKPGPSAGDLLAFSNRLARGGKALGSLDVACMFARLEEHYECHGTAFLPGGRLAVTGSLSLDQPTNVVPVVGGTGRYRRMRGTLTARQTGDDTSAITFNVTR